MKIPKTEKEFVERLTAAFRDLYVALDLEFKDPEEPKLPEKVRISCIGEGTREHPWVHVLVPEDEKDGYRDSDDHEITAEAAARYNAVGRYLRPAEHSTPPETLGTLERGRDLRAILAEERERLQ